MLFEREKARTLFSLRTVTATQIKKSAAVQTIFPYLSRSTTFSLFVTLLLLFPLLSFPFLFFSFFLCLLRKNEKQKTKKIKHNNISHPLQAEFPCAIFSRLVARTAKKKTQLDFAPTTILLFCFPGPKTRRAAARCVTKCTKCYKSFQVPIIWFVYFIPPRQGTKHDFSRGRRDGGTGMKAILLTISEKN